MTIHSLVRTLALIVILLAGPSALEAQSGAGDGAAWYDGHVSALAGVSIFDRDDVAATGVYAIRADMPIYPNLLVEAGLAYAHPARTVKDLFIPGIQAQLQGQSGRFSPYVGLGAGLTIEVPEGEGGTDTSFSPSFATGVRIDVSEGAGVRFEGRLNAVGADFQAIYSEITAGLIISW